MSYCVATYSTRPLATAFATAEETRATLRRSADIVSMVFCINFSGRRVGVPVFFFTIATALPVFISFSSAYTFLKSEDDCFDKPWYFWEKTQTACLPISPLSSIVQTRYGFRFRFVLLTICLLRLLLAWKRYITWLLIHMRFLAWNNLTTTWFFISTNTALRYFKNPKPIKNVFSGKNHFFQSSNQSFIQSQKNHPIKRTVFFFCLIGIQFE